MTTTRISLAQMSEESRIWIYQASRPLTFTEQSKMARSASGFVSQWAAHGHPLSATFDILHDQFLVIAVDESTQMATGCSIDSSVHMVKKLEEDLEVSFFDRLLVAYWSEEKVKTIHATKVKEKIQDGSFSRETLVFNHAVTTLEQWKNGWLVPAESTWLKKYFH